MAGESGTGGARRAVRRRNPKGRGCAPAGVRNSGARHGSQLELALVPRSECFRCGQRCDFATNRPSYRTDAIEGMMRIGPGLLVCLLGSWIVLLAARDAKAQSATNGTEIPLQRCDRLPVAILQVDKADKRFLIDTAATSLLNEKSFIRGGT